SRGRSYTLTRMNCALQARNPCAITVWASGHRRTGALLGALLEHLADGGHTSQHSGGVDREEDLGRLAVGDALQRFQVADRHQVGTWITHVDVLEDPLDGASFTVGNGLFTVPLGAGHPLDGSGLTIGLMHLGLLDALGTEDGGALGAFRLGDQGTAIALG